MAKELMEIGGFITEGAEIVNHDASLSGNGTVDSPLGVVPGYNETVLWSGVSHTGNLSESVENFDTVKINYITDDGIQGMSEFIPAYGKNITLDSMYVASNSAVWIKTTNYTFSANTSFASYPFQTYVSNNKITATWYSNTANSTFRLTRVIGINRKAQ